MIPALTDPGRSFKGAAAYYLHDKREEGEAERFTDERVGWTETRNLATDDADRGWRIMAATALNQAQLKAAAGVKATGRKLTKPAYAYSLSWGPDEQPTRDQMREAADSSLKALGLEQHQAIIACHTDTRHPHVHIIVNRVHPETGKAADLGNAKLTMSKWAQAYEERQGKIRVPQRVENNAARAKGQQARAPRKSRADYERDRAVSNDNLSAEFVRTQQRQKDAAYYQARRDMAQAHTRQWEALTSTYATVRGRMLASVRAVKDKKTAAIKEQARPRWRELFRQQRLAQRNFEAAERGLLSRLSNMIFTFQAIRRTDHKADALTIFYTLLSSSQRRAVFDHQQEMERRELAHAISQDIRAAGREVDRSASGDFARLRREYLAQCGQLRATQGAEKQAMKQARDRRNAERTAAMGPARPERAPRRQRQREQGRGRSIRDDDAYPRPSRGPKPAGP